MVTHQLQFIKKATKILVIKDGKLLSVGNYDDLLKSGLDFMSILKQPEEKNKKENDVSDNFAKPRTFSNISIRSEVRNKFKS